MEWVKLDLKEVIVTSVSTGSAGGRMPPAVKRKLRQAGISQMGITQLSMGQPISNPKDREIVSQIVTAALGGKG